MLNDGTDDKKLSDIMKKGMLEMPFTDFEDKVMRKVHKKYAYRGAVSKNIKLSGLFFLLGTGFGLAINFFLLHINRGLMGLSPEKILLFFQAIFTFIFLSQLEKIVRLVNKS